MAGPGFSHELHNTWEVVFLKRKTILVTGANGMLGTQLVRSLKDNPAYEEYQVLTPDRSQLDLEDPRKVLEFFSENKPHTVFHLAAKVMGLRGNLDFQMQSMRTNLRINEAVFSAAAAFPPDRLFFAGTAASYAYPYLRIPLLEEDFFVGDVHDGEFGYAWAKRMAYPWLRLLASDFGVAWTYGIFTNLFGPNDRFQGDYTHVVPALINRAGGGSGLSSGQRLEVWGRPDVTRDFLYAPEAAKAAIVSMECGSHDGLILNIASGQETSMGVLAEQIAFEFGYEGVQWRSDMPIGVRNRYMDISKLKSIGFSPELNLECQIHETANWYKENKFNLR